MSQKLGKHTAQQLMHELLAPGSRDIDDVVGAVVASGAATAEEGRAWASWDVGDTGGMVDAVVGPGSACPRNRAGGVGVNPPRINLVALPTPLERMHRLEAVLQAGPLYVKRDDLTGFGVAGNKARALEYLMGAALDGGADVLVAAGSPSSNFCAAAALAAATVGLDCDLLFPGTPPTTPSVNVELARATGARLLFGVVGTREELDDAVLDHANALRAEGRRPYPLPRGGATPVGAIGYVYAARELAEQCDRAGIQVADGSGRDWLRRHPGRAGRWPGRIRPDVAARRCHR